MTSPFVLVVWGDSIAAGNEAYKWPALTERMAGVVNNPGRPVRVINEGVSGNPAAQAVHEFEDKILPHAPDLVIIQFGFNDIRCDGSRGALPLSMPDEFLAHLCRMIDDCQKRAAARVVVFGNHQSRVRLLMPNGKTYEDNRRAYNAIAQQAAKISGATYYDLEHELPTPETPWNQLIGEDGVHLSPLGMYAYARFAASLILQFSSLSPPSPRS